MAYHAQTNELTEKSNRTLTDMLAKRVERNGKGWDIHLPFVLFAYRASVQESVKESPFYLLLDVILCYQLCWRWTL